MSILNVLRRGAVLAVATTVLMPFYAQASDEIELEFELPEKFFGGTPIDYWSVHLEEPSFKPRDPFKAPAGTEVISRDKEVTSSTEDPAVGELKQIVDGDKDYAKASLVELGEGVQWVQIDLGAVHEIYAILLWHFHEGNRVYFDVEVQVSNDKDFKEGVTTVYNNDFDNSAGLGVGEDMEYIEDERGRLIDAKGAKGQYVRFYSNKNTDNDMNHYVEAEVWGKAAE